MFAFVRVGAHACFTSRRLHVCRNVCWRMIEVDQVVSEAPVRERAAFLLEFSTHASCLNHPFQCPLPGSDGGGNTDQLPFETCYYYHQRGGSPPAPAPILLSSETEGESVPLVSEMFIYATVVPKDMEKPLLQVMTVKPQHIIHFPSLNLVFSMGKFFWSPHPVVKHGRYSVMWELHL